MDCIYFVKITQRKEAQPSRLCLFSFVREAGFVPIFHSAILVDAKRYKHRVGGI